MAHLFLQRLLSTLLTCGIFVSATASAMGLVQAYDAARLHDPAYRSAEFENQAGQQYKELGRSNLLPTLSASYSRYKNKADITSPNIRGIASTSHRDYMSTTSAIQLRQPLLNLEGIARYSQGVAQTHYSDEQFAARSQDLITRLMGLYVEVKYAEDNLRLIEAQRDSYAEHKRMNDRLFSKGEGTKTDMLETQAKLDSAEAELLDAQDKLGDARQALANVVGEDITELDSLRADFLVKPLNPATLEDWRQLALVNSPDIAAQRYAVDAAEAEISKNQAGHAPRLDLIASLSKNTSESIATFNQDIKTRSVGVQLNIPLYSGGYTSAVTRQSYATRDKALSDLDTKTNQTKMEVNKQYGIVSNATQRISATQAALDSADALLIATQKSAKGGMRTNLDVLNAQQQRLTAQRDATLARYNYLLAYLRLRQAAGVLGEDDVHDIAQYFVGSN